MAGGLILCLGMLTLCALPTETAAHTTGLHQTPPDRLPSEIIQWIRVYKNPKTVPRAALNQIATSFTSAGRPVFDPPAEYGLTGLQPFLMPSYNYWVGGTRENYTDPTLFWVQFKPSNHPDDPGGLIDTGENSGLVTETENTSVQEGDIVAIAVRTRGLGRQAQPDMAIGPSDTKTYDINNSSGDRFLNTRKERRWRLNPNMPMYHQDNWWTRPDRVNRYYDDAVAVDYEHTMVYQFKVGPEHVLLNGEGAWLKPDFVPAPVTIRQGFTVRNNVDRGGGRREIVITFEHGNIIQAIDWLWDEARGVLPSDTSVNPFNAFDPLDNTGREWGVYAETTGMYSDASFSLVVGWPSLRRNTSGDTEVSHRHPVLYDPARPGKEPIYYPLVIAGASEQVARISGVPEASVTGSFTVTLHFATDFGEVELFVGHDVSDADVDAFQDALTAALAKAGSPFEVVSLSYAGGIQTPASLATGPRAAGTSTQYTLTLLPPSGVDGNVALAIPAEVVSAAGEMNPASEPVDIPVDTLLREVVVEESEVVAPDGGAYVAGDEIVVRVTFAQDGLTYEGDNPPYITISLGDDNFRHATWQQGEETPGSTVVPFAYTLDTTDPIVSSVSVPENSKLLVPAATTVSISGSLQARIGTADVPAPKGSGEAAPKPASDNEGVSLTDSAGSPLPRRETPVDVLPVILLPSEEEPSEPKADASSVPRTPVVFNELGNGNGDTNDWLEFRNVTGSAVSLKDWELSVVQDGMKEDTSLIVFPDVSVPANGLLLITNSDPSSEGNMLAGGENKGLTHHYIVNAGLSLPDDGKFLLILRNAKEKLGLNEAFVDVAGGGGSGTDAFVRETTGDYDTHVWPLQVLAAPGGNTEDALSAGKVWLRAKADIVGYHKDAWAEAAFTGVGYDRMVSKSAETAGTPGYPNGAVKIEAATPRGALTFSEVMLDSAGGTLPQWIELYNSSKTDALNLERWKLEIQNVDSEDLVGRPVVTLTLAEKVIQPNQTLLIVAGNARASSADVFPADRVYNLLALHEKNLRIKSARDTFLSAKGFYLKLIDRNGNVVDEIGNTDGDRRTQDEPIWALPVLTDEGPRSSIIRRYTKGVVSDGASRFGWVLSANFKHFKTGEAVVADTLYYGHADDVGSPGYRQGGALPVELSAFTVTREENGAVLLTWTTESEVDNAGFNVRRSLRRDSGYALLNPVLIAGAGTTGERQTYTFIDTSAKPGVEHYYQLEEVSLAGQPQVLVTRRLRGPVSPAHRALKTLGEVKQVK